MRCPPSRGHGWRAGRWARALPTPLYRAGSAPAPPALSAHIDPRGLARLADGRVAGRVRRDRDGSLLFVATRDERRHQLRCPLAWALDVSLLDALARAGVQRVCITTARAVYTAPLAEFFASTALRLDRGHGVQRAVPLGLWRVEPRGGPRQLALFAPEGGAL